MDKVTRQFRLQQWAEALRDHKESGLTVMEWCRLHNVSKYQFYYRQREVRKHAAQFLALQPVQADKPAFVQTSLPLLKCPMPCAPSLQRLTQIRFFPESLPASGPETPISSYQMRPVKSSWQRSSGR